MKISFFRRCFVCVVSIFPLLVSPMAVAQVMPPSNDDNLKLLLLGTGVGPPVNLQQFGASTLIEAGGIRRPAGSAVVAVHRSRFGVQRVRAT
jgi:hypothetical protein